MTFDEWFGKTFPDNDDSVSTIIIKEIARQAWNMGSAHTRSDKIITFDTVDTDGNARRREVIKCAKCGVFIIIKDE